MKYITALATTILLSSPVSVNAFSLGDLNKAANFAKTAQNATSSNSADAGRCDPVVASTENLAPLAKAKSMATKKVIELAINRLTKVLGGTEPVGMINSYCDVDKKLAALEVESIRLGNYVKASTQKSLDALANGNSSISGNTFSDTDGSLSALTKQIKKNSKKAQKKAKKVNSVNNELLEEAISDLNASLKPAALLLAHNISLANFIKDNPRWAVENAGQAKLFVTQINLLLASGAAVRKIREATAANEQLGLNADLIAAATQIKEQALELQAAQEIATHDI